MARYRGVSVGDAKAAAVMDQLDSGTVLPAKAFQKGLAVWVPNPYPEVRRRLLPPRTRVRTCRVGAGMHACVHSSTQSRAAVAQ